MEENKNDIDELVKSIDSSFEEMSLKDIVAAHENYFGADDISFDKDKTEEEKKKEKSEVFDVFWDKYHETMQKPKQYVARARREWDKLTKEEQQTAIDHIEEVYYHTNDTRFIPLAATYLKDKAFLNEYID